MAHPYDDNGFRHYLKFYDFGMDWYEISEPVGFDGAKYVKEQLPNRWGRDLEYFAIDGIRFVDARGIRTVAPFVWNPQGDVSNHLDYGLAFLLENRRIRGSEMKVGYKVSRNGADFKEFELDSRDEDLTDGETYFKCKLIEIGLVADHFRNLKNTFNAFSDKDWKGNTITPIESFNYLCKATPQNLTSIFECSSNFSFHAEAELGQPPLVGINPSQNLTESQINDTLGWLDPVQRGSSLNDFPNFKLIKAVKDTNNIVVTIDLDFDYQITNNNPSDPCELLYLLYIDGTLERVFFNLSAPPLLTISGTITNSYTHNIDTLDVGKEIRCYMVAAAGGAQSIDGLFRKNTIRIDVVETDLDIVVPAVRYFDLIRQGAKYVNNLPVLFTNFNQFESQAVFSRSLLEQRKELYTTNEDLQKSLQEYCADVEISKDNINIRQHQDFYENVEIGSFLVIPSEDYSEPYDETYLINNLGYGYKNFEQDRTAKNTSQSFHTFAEFLPKNERADKQKKIENEFIRDPFLKQATFNLAIRTPSTSTEKDEKLFIEDMVQLAPNTSREFVRTLLVRWQDGKLEILNRNTLGTNDDAILNWNNIGLGIGSSFQILSAVSGNNIGNYTVFSINTAGSVLTLTPVGAITQASGNDTIRIKHFYSNVNWQTRTTEGFSIAPKGYSNLAYTIKRNLKYWYYYLGTATIYCKKDIVNSFFKNFGKLETQLTTETTPVIEDATILYEDLFTPLVEPIIIKAKIVAQYADVLEYLENYRTVKGYVTILKPDGNIVKVYTKNFEYTIATSEAIIEGEKKFEDEFLRIDIVGEEVLVNDAPFNLSGVAKWFNTKNDFIQLYKKNSIPISSYYRYDFVLLNGVKYNSITELVTQLNTVVWT